MEFVIAKLVHLPRLNGRFVQTGMDNPDYEKKPFHPVRKSYAERINKFWKENGKFYVIDEEKSVEYGLLIEEQTKQREAQRQAKTLTDANVIGQVLNQGILAVQGAQASQERETKKPEPKPQNVGTPQPRKEGGNDK